MSEFPVSFLSGFLPEKFPGVETFGKVSWVGNRFHVGLARRFAKSFLFDPWKLSTLKTGNFGRASQ
jgi:hypothetical protein